MLLRLGLGTVISLALQGCYFLQKPTIPIEVDYFSASHASNASDKTLLILLPGIGDGGDAFKKHGFIEDVQELWPTADVAAVNAHFGYYRNRSVVDRIYTDVIERARKQGYDNIHIAGISLGGFGALLYQRDTNDNIASLMLLAPYLGEENSFEYVQNGGEPPQPVPDDNIWPWLQSLSADKRQAMYLGYGAGDKFAHANGLLGEWLPESNVCIVPGKHNWKTWKVLWRELLKQNRSSASI